MNESEQKYISRLKEHLGKIDDTTARKDLEIWQKSVEFDLERIFGKRSTELKKFSHILFYSQVHVIGGSSSDQIDEEHRIDGIKKARSMINDFISIIENYGLKECGVKSTKSNSGGISVNNYNNVQQSQNQNISTNFIIENIQESLSDNKLLELKEILQGIQKGKSSSSKLVNFLKEFSSGVAENILASIILNPTILNQLIK